MTTETKDRQVDLFDDIPPTPQETQSKWNSLKGQQRTIAQKAVEWLKEPVDPRDVNTIIGTIRGYAGTGKSYMMGALVEYMVSAMGIPCMNIRGVTPTHATATNLENYALIPTSTIHSFLGLRMMKVRLTPEEKIELERLREAKATAPYFSPDDDLHLKILEATEYAENEKLKELRPTMDPESFAKAWGAVNDKAAKPKADKIWPKVLIVDEVFMLNKELVNNLYTLVAFNNLLPIPKILCVGDPGQVPPVGEVMSEAINFPVIGELTEPVRQAGIQLQYVNTIREGTEDDIKGAHYQFMEHGGDELFQLKQSTVLANVRASIEEVGYENFRILTTSNARVQELNRACYEAMYPDRPYDRPYAVGEVLLTKGPVMRDPAYPNRPGATDGDILFSTSTPITIDNVYTPIEKKNILGSKYLVSMLDCRSGKHVATVQAPHPLEIAQWVEEKDSITKMAKSCTWKNLNKPQKGEYAKKVWKILGLKNWDEVQPSSKLEKRKDFGDIQERWEYLYDRYGAAFCAGKNINRKTYLAIGKYLWQARYQHQQLADNLSLSFASTTHTSQGLTIPICIIDFTKFFPRTGYKGDGTWDSHKIFYTAITRVGESNGIPGQLILMRGGLKK